MVPSVLKGAIFYVVLAVAFLAVAVDAKVDYSSCLSAVRAERTGQPGGTDNNGIPVPISNKTTAITYGLCKEACGAGQEPFEWTVFSQQFSAWLLPWLALVSQLPFGARSRLGNLTSVILTLGSPVLAAYSLALTALNGQWIKRRFANYSYPNRNAAVRVLRSLQQAPLRINKRQHLLISLVILPENDHWWQELADWLDYTHTWSISAATSIAWVIIAYVFTVIDSLGNVSDNINSNGQGVGSLLLWLVPVVVGWLQISPKCDSSRLNKAFKNVQHTAHMMTPGGPVLAGTVTGERGISIEGYNEDVLNSSVSRDEGYSAPIFNYARFLPWVQAVEDVAAVFRVASENALHHIPVDGDSPWHIGAKEEILPGNRRGTLDQVVGYCKYANSPLRSRWGSDTFRRMILASAVALVLQWGTSGAAIIVVWYTPTTGLGCRSGSYILYGIISTLIWLMLLASSILAHYSDPHTPRYPYTPAISWKRRLSAFSSIFLRRLGKLLAAGNTVWLLVACMFQFSNVFDTCYCNSSVLGHGANAYDVLELTDNELGGVKAAWIGGVFLASGCAFLFVGFLNLSADVAQ